MAELEDATSSRDGRLVRGEEARRQILDAAAALLAEQGLGGVSVAAVGRRAGVSRALVHYHFETHAALLEEAIEVTYRVARPTLTDDSRQLLGTFDALAAKVEASLPIAPASRREWELWIELWAGAVRDPELRAIAVGIYARLHAVLAEIVARGIEDGALPAVDVDRAVDRVLALMDGYGLRVFLGDATVSEDEARAQVRQGLADVLGIDASTLP